MIKKSSCVGCSACYDVCSRQAIRMIEDIEGFLYPYTDQTKCINCGICARVCPVQLDKKIVRNNIKCYAAKNKLINIQMNSASGGVFSQLAMAILNTGGVVVGAGFNENWNVIHKIVANTEQMKELCRSKYVQSDLQGIYREIKKLLDSGKSVLFSGTPCQSSAVAAFVGHERCKNLYLVDIICHGVPSPKIWQDFINQLSIIHNNTVADIESISFKYKDETYKWNRPGFYLKWKNGEEYLDYSNKSWYENGYLGNLYVRPACHNCNFKQLKSPSDITIGDFWGCEKIAPDFYDENGVSIVISKTEKGEILLNSVLKEFFRMGLSFEEACKYNPRILLSSVSNPNREKFWEKYRYFNHEDANIYSRLVNGYAKDRIPKVLILKVKKIIKRLIRREQLS